MYVVLALMSAWAHVATATVDPGYLPLPSDVATAPATLPPQLRWCRKCNTFKTPRAHHCSECQRCVLKMDHHCPWVNNCIGLFNVKQFVLFNLVRDTTPSFPPFSLKYVGLLCFTSLGVIISRLAHCSSFNNDELKTMPYIDPARAGVPPLGLQAAPTQLDDRAQLNHVSNDLQKILNLLDSSDAGAPPRRLEMELLLTTRLSRRARYRQARAARRQRSGKDLQSQVGQADII